MLSWMQCRLCLYKILMYKMSQTICYKQQEIQTAGGGSRLPLACQPVPGPEIVGSAKLRKREHENITVQFRIIPTISLTCGQALYVVTSFTAATKETIHSDDPRQQSLATQMKSLITSYNRRQNQLRHFVLNKGPF